MANNSSSASDSDGKVNNALLNFGNAKRLCLFYPIVTQGHNKNEFIGLC